MLSFLTLGGSRNKMNFTSQANDAGMAFACTLDDIQKSGCRGNVPTSVPSSVSKLPDGINFGEANALSVNWEVEASGKIPFPLDQILAGKSFVIETGRQTSDTGQVKMSIHVEFTAR